MGTWLDSASASFVAADGEFLPAQTVAAVGSAALAVGAVFAVEQSGHQSLLGSETNKTDMAVGHMINARTQIVQQY